MPLEREGSAVVGLSRGRRTGLPSSVTAWWTVTVREAERHEPGSSIRSFGQALWWALTTFSTVGYGDSVPVSTQGRFIAALLMIGGVALGGVVTATLASWIVSLVDEENAEQEAATQAQVAALQAQVSELSERIDRLLAERDSDRG